MLPESSKVILDYDLNTFEGVHTTLLELLRAGRLTRDEWEREDRRIHAYGHMARFTQLLIEERSRAT